MQYPADTFIEIMTEEGEARVRISLAVQPLAMPNSIRPPGFGAPGFPMPIASQGVRTKADDLAISPQAAELILQALRPVVHDHLDIEASVASASATENATNDA